MRAVEQTEYIVQALRMAGSMYEDDARSFLAEHDAGVRADALAEGSALLRRQAGLKVGRPVYDSGLRAGAILLDRAADRPAPEADFFQPERTYRANDVPFVFHSITHTLWPDGTVRAIGRGAWTDRTSLHWLAVALPAVDWAGGAWGGWTDITGEVTP